MQVHAEARSLATLQRALAAALLASDARAQAAPLPWFRDEEAARAGLRVHRNTVLGGCWNALRLSYPALECWLGETVFEALAADFARAQPPAEPALSRYGEPFGVFVAARLSVDAAPFALALAEFEWLLERASQDDPRPAVSGVAIALAGGVSLRLAASLRIHCAHWRVDVFREQLLARGAAPAPTTLPPGGLARKPFHWALWRTQQGVHQQSLSASAAALLRALLAGATLADALELAAAAAEADSEEVAAATTPAALASLLEHEVLRARFASLSQLNPSSGESA